MGLAPGLAKGTVSLRFRRRRRNLRVIFRAGGRLFGRPVVALEFTSAMMKLRLRKGKGLFRGHMAGFGPKFFPSPEHFPISILLHPMILFSYFLLWAHKYVPAIVLGVET